MDEIAPVPVNAKQAVLETATFLCFVFGVVFVVFAQLREPMGKFTPLLIGTVPVLHELLAELRLFLFRLFIDGSFPFILSGVGVALLVGPHLSSVGSHCSI